MTITADPTLLDLARVEQFLDEHGLGTGALAAAALGDGHSNLTFLLSRGDSRYVLRRPPRPPYPPSAHNVIREAKLIEAGRSVGLPVPAVLAKVDDAGILGVPFVVMEFVDGYAISNDLPAALASPAEATRIGEALIGALVDIHAVEIASTPLEPGARTAGYLERQLRRFAKIRESTRIRPVPGLDEVGAWLAANRPTSQATTLVHGDYRLGNVLFARESPARLAAILDWELAAIGDPLADLGYLCATWAETADPQHQMLALSAATRSSGFPTRAELAASYAKATGLDVSFLAWYEVLAMWKAAIFLETSYGRYIAGTASDPYFASLEHGVPQIASAAWERVRHV
jgi:aminoglycoside phosphotransferase (APT) family kinase protein